MFVEEKLLPEALQRRRIDAVRELLDALQGGDEESIAAAARVVHRLGANDARIPWTRVEDYERRLAARGWLRESLARGDVEGTAKAWAHFNALWPGQLEASAEQQGLAAFRAWGRSLRAGERRAL